MGPNETFKLLHSKGNHKQDEKTTLRMGENICKWSNDKGLISKIYKQLIQLNIRKGKQPNPKWVEGASLVAQGLGVHLPMQGIRVLSLAWEDPTCHRATKPGRHIYWASALEPVSHNCWSLHATTAEAHTPRACALQQEKPPQWEACAPQQIVAPTRGNQRNPACSNEDPMQPKINK